MMKNSMLPVLALTGLLASCSPSKYECVPSEDIYCPIYCALDASAAGIVKLTAVERCSAIDCLPRVPAGTSIFVLTAEWEAKGYDRTTNTANFVTIYLSDEQATVTPELGQRFFINLQELDDNGLCQSSTPDYATYVALGNPLYLIDGEENVLADNPDVSVDDVLGECASAEAFRDTHPDDTAVVDKIDCL